MSTTIKEIKKVGKDAINDPYHAVIFARKISPYFTWILLRIGIGANLTTLFSFLFIIGGGYFFTKPDPYSWLIGWSIVQFYHILDCSDGEVARFRRSNSKFGGMFDSMLHPLGNAVIFSAVSVGLYYFHNNVTPLFVGFGTVIILMMMSIVRLHGLLIIGREVGSVESKRKSIIGKLIALFTEIGGLFHMLALASIGEILLTYIGYPINVRLYFLYTFTIASFMLLLKKIFYIKNKATNPVIE